MVCIDSGNWRELIEYMRIYVSPDLTTLYEVLEWKIMNGLKYISLIPESLTHTITPKYLRCPTTISMELHRHMMTILERRYHTITVSELVATHSYHYLYPTVEHIFGLIDVEEISRHRRWVYRALRENQTKKSHSGERVGGSLCKICNIEAQEMNVSIL